MGRKTASTVTADSTLLSWIHGYLADKPLSKAEKVVLWQRWANLKLAAGMTAYEIRERIQAAWKRHASLNMISEELIPIALARACAEVWHMADTGSPPRACAVVYRSLAIEYPDFDWLGRYAEIWSKMEAW